jgi:hypothetical protein
VVAKSWHVRQCRYPHQPPSGRTVTAVGRDYMEGAVGPGIPVRIVAPPPTHLLDDGVYGGPQAGSYPPRLRSGVAVGGGVAQIGAMIGVNSTPSNDPSRYR